MKIKRKCFDTNLEDMNRWRAMVNQPTNFRIGTSQISLRSANFLNLFLIAFVFSGVIFLFVYIKPVSRSPYQHFHQNHQAYVQQHEYNNTYPLTKPIINKLKHSNTFKVLYLQFLHNFHIITLIFSCRSV